MAEDERDLDSGISREDWGDGILYRFNSAPQGDQGILHCKKRRRQQPRINLSISVSMSAMIRKRYQATAGCLPAFWAWTAPGSLLPASGMVPRSACFTTRWMSERALIVKTQHLIPRWSDHFFKGAPILLCTSRTAYR